MPTLKTIKAAVAKALGLGLGAAPTANAPPGLWQYLAYLDKPGKFQQKWSYYAADDLEAWTAYRAGVSPGGRWYGWTINRVIRINWPEPNTPVPEPLPPEPEESTDPEPDA